jgi:hypothetical protein
MRRPKTKAAKAWATNAQKKHLFKWLFLAWFAGLAAAFCVYA